ncbi:VOC family protein [Sphingomonas sp. JC676]|uniref:VOC family protein n=1 Tax=Sphingomonas sp. JC676 TaxID=2768065 RepID=UPI001658076C|nr:VOC family protein [Sphingomonas sp. JC676]MBC9032770.1 VOC family protein [Sphingomonas sp. JC676]
MFKDQSSSAIVAVSDLARARRFYAETLDLEVTMDTEEVLTFRTGKTLLNVYRSAEAGTNRANAVVWGAGDAFDATADELRSRGVTFEEYPDMGMQIAGGVHSAGDFKAIWFKDPDGNILHINSGG